MSPLLPEFWPMVGTAALCGAIIGLERQLRGKPAGIRTSILICLATAFFVRLGAGVGSSGGDPTRVLANVVAGVGFLGAGVIMAREGLVMGVTSAAVIWVLAGIGAMIGFREYTSGLASSLVTVGVLVGIQYLEIALHHLRRGDYAHEGRNSRSDSRK